MLSGSSYGSFWGQVWSGEGSEENPIVERDVFIHALVPEENEEPIPVPASGSGCRSLMERQREQLVEWDSDNNSSSVVCY